MNQTAVLLAGADRKRLFELVGLFEHQPRLQVQTRVTPEGDHAVLAGISSRPDILVLLLDAHWRETLSGLLSVPRSQRPELVVISDAHYSEVMQMAMQAGARDYLVWDQAGEALLPSLHGIAADLQSGREFHGGKLIAVINSKGGAGASFVAANVGHMLRASAKKSVALIDLDFTFSPLPAYYDITPKNSLADALARPPDEIDATALSGYMTSHQSGVDVLASTGGQLSVSWATPSDRVLHLIELALASYDYVIVDMPRNIEPHVQQILERSEKIVLVVQQSLMHLRDAKLLRQLFAQEFDIADDRIRPLINRFDKKNQITPKHIEQALGIESAWQVPNDYDLVSESIETGTLLFELSPRARVSKALRAVADDLSGKRESSGRSVLGRLFPIHGT
jgi:pilus assembly protein CpaE